VASRGCRAHPLQTGVKKLLLKTQYKPIYNPNMKKPMTIKLLKIIAANHLQLAISRSKTPHLVRHSEPLAGEESAYFSRRPCRLLNFDFCTLIFDIQKNGSPSFFGKANPI